LHADAMLGGHEQALAELVDLSDQAIRYTRSLTFELSPPILYELGLGPALEWFGEQVAAKHGLQVEVRAHDRGPLPDDLKVMLWKCARELVHNVVKHAQARRVTIELDRRAGQVILEVADDGRGFDPSSLQADRDDHFGLLAIEERLRDDGGGLGIDSRPGQGTRVRLHADLPGGGA
ncbi:MAG: sensor histidine kinase, partial [Candidatus Krumholzibacteriia bacterium]